MCKQENKVMLSIIMAVYNHEKYVQKAVQSILMQKINVLYEVLIGEDCSTDNTRAVLKNMEKDLPVNYHIFYRETNWGAKENYKDLEQRTCGKYVAILEGDDYWTYPYKLQKQIDFLESHPDYMAVCHNVEVVDKLGNRYKDYSYPECKKNEYTLYDFRKGILSGQTASIVERNNYHGELFQDKFVLPENYPGDRKRVFMHAAYGKVYCIQKTWSAYRYVAEEGDSWAARMRTQSQSIIDGREYEFLKAIYKYSCDEIKTKDSIYTSESMLLIFMFLSVIGVLKADISFREWIRQFLKGKYKCLDMAFIIRRTVKIVFDKIWNRRVKSI